MMTIDCPKYESCNAPVCPMWPDWRKTAHLKGEAVCLWLREWSKEGGEQRVRVRIREDQVEAVSQAYLEITIDSLHLQPCQGAGLIRRELDRASRSASMFSPTRLENLNRKKSV